MRLLVIEIERTISFELPDVGVNLAEQVAAALQPQRRYVVGKGQAVDPVVGIGGIAEEPIRVPSFAEEAGGLPGRLNIVVEPHHVGKPDRAEGRNAIARLEHLDDRAQVRPIRGADPPRLDAVVFVAGEDPVAAGVVKIIVR